MKLAIFIYSSGIGLRMRPLTESIPKPFLPLKSNKGTLEINVEYISKLKQPYNLFINYSYRKELFETLQTKYTQSNITIIEDLDSIGHAGIIFENIDKFCNYDAILGINGDTLIEFDIEKFITSNGEIIPKILCNQELNTPKSNLYMDENNVLRGIKGKNGNYIYNAAQNTEIPKSWNRVENLGVELFPVKLLIETAKYYDHKFMGLYGTDDLFEIWLKNGYSTKCVTDVAVSKYFTMNTIEEYNELKQKLL